MLTDLSVFLCGVTTRVTRITYTKYTYDVRISGDMYANVNAALGLFMRVGR